MSASFGVARQPAHRVLEIAAHPHRVRARYDHEVRILARLDRSVDPRHRLLERPQPLRHIGVLTEGMVFDVDRGGARLLERLHGAPDVRSVVEPAFGIGDHWRAHCVGDGSHLFDHVAERK